jgi:hypothetical protein
MAKRRKKRKQKAGVSQRVSQRQVTVIHVGDQKSKRRKKATRRKRTGAISAAETATATISASMGRPVDLGLMDPQLQQVLDAHSTMQRQTLYNTPYQSAASRYGLSAGELSRGALGFRQFQTGGPPSTGRAPPPPASRPPSTARGVPVTERLGQTAEGANPTLGGAQSEPLGLAELGGTSRSLRASESPALVRSRAARRDIAAALERAGATSSASIAREALLRAKQQRAPVYGDI